MPNLYNFDNFEMCLGSFNRRSPFCIVNSVIVPNSSSTLYDEIRNFSRNAKQHLRHDKLQYGICLHSCLAILDKLGGESQNYFIDQHQIDSKAYSIYNDIKYPKAEHDRKLFNDAINKCVNIQLVEYFNLKAFSSIEYCLHPDVSEPLGMPCGIIFNS